MQEIFISESTYFFLHFLWILICILLDMCIHMYGGIEGYWVYISRPAPAWWYNHASSTARLRHARLAAAPCRISLPGLGQACNCDDGGGCGEHGRCGADCSIPAVARSVRDDENFQTSSCSSRQSCNIKITHPLWYRVCIKEWDTAVGAAHNIPLKLTATVQSIHYP